MNGPVHNEDGKSRADVINELHGDRNVIDRLVHRQRLIDAIEQPFLDRVTAIVAPVGYGKTTLVRQWIRQTGKDVCRVSGDVARSASRSIHAQFVAEIVPLLNAEGIVAARFDGEMPCYGAVLATLPPTVIVLDDVDETPEDELGSLINELAEVPTLHIVVVSRRPLTVSALGSAARAGQLRVVGAEDLRFTEADISVLLRRFDDVPTEQTAAEVAARTAGWTTGVVMEYGGKPGADHGSIQYLLETYVQFNILKGIPDNIMPIVLAVCELPFLDDDIFSAMTGNLNRTYSIADLRQDYPFLLDQGNGRYIHISQVAEIIKRMADGIDPENARRSLLISSVDYLDECGRSGDARELAIHLGYWEDVLRLLNPVCRELAYCDKHKDVLDLLDPIPHRVFLHDSDLAFWSLVATLSCGRIKQGKVLYDHVASVWDASDDTLSQGRLLICQALLAIFDGRRDHALASAQRSLDILPDDAIHERFRASASCSVLAAHLGLRELSRAMFRLATHYRAGLPHEQEWWHVFVLPDQADRMALDGDLFSAARLYEHQLITFPDGIRDRESVIHLRLALIEIERNNLVEARGHLDSIARIDLGAYWDLEVCLARIQLMGASGNHREAIDLAEQTMRQASARWSDVLLHRADAQIAALWIERGDLALARSWAERTSFTVDSWPRTFGLTVPQTVLAHLLIAEGAPRGALDILDMVIEDGTRRGQPGPLVRAHALAALAHANLDQWDRTVAALDRAAQDVKPGSFVRSFIVSGFDTRTLAHRKAVQTLKPLSSSLTRRELEVLQLLDGGLKTQQIADYLSLSHYTVKTHLAKIYAKLDAPNRTTALARARTQGLLPSSPRSDVEGTLRPQ